jgi:WD40 repeat protein
MRSRRSLRILCLPLAAYLIAAGILWYFIGPQPTVTLRAPEKLSLVGFTPDSRLLITRPVEDWLVTYGSISTGPIRIWDVATGQEHHRILEDAADLGAMALSPDGQQLVVLRPDQVTIVDVASGSQLAAWPCQPATGQGFLWSPDGKSLASIERVGGNQVRVRLFDARTLEVRLTLEELDVNSNVAFSPDGRWLATGDKGPSFKTMESQNIRLWDTATGQLVRTFRVEDEYLMGSFAFSADGTLVMADCNKTVVWEVSTGEKLIELKEKYRDIRSPGFLPKGEGLVSVDCSWRRPPGSDMHLALKVRDPRTGTTTLEVDLGPAYGGATLCVSDNGRMAGVQYTRYGIPVSTDRFLRSAGFPRPWLNHHLASTWRVFELASGKELLAVRNSQLVFSPCSLVATSNCTPEGDGAVRIYDLPAPKPVGLILGWGLAAPLVIVVLQLACTLTWKVLAVKKRPASCPGVNHLN